MERNKKIYLTSDGTEETGKKIIAYLEWLGGDNSGDFTYLHIAKEEEWIYWFIDNNNDINSYTKKGMYQICDYEYVDINTILFDDNYNVIEDITEDTDDSDNTEECLKIIVNNIINKRT